MKFGFVMPPIEPRETVQHAVEAEQTGWNGFFLSESMWSADPPVTIKAASEQIAEWEAAGATWWIESWWGEEEARLRRMRQGPPVR